MKQDTSELKIWLKKTGNDRFWLASQMGVSKRTVDNWFSDGFPSHALLRIDQIRGKLVSPAASKPESSEQIDGDSKWVLRPTLEEFDIWNRASMAAGMTIREWIVHVIKTAAAEEMEDAACRASQENAESGIVDFPEIPLLHAAAGSPISADGDTWSPPRDVGEGRFACRLHGDSMSPKFPDGSTVILRERDSLKRPVLKSGEIYLFVRQGERCLKVWESRPATKKEIDEGIAYRSEKDGKLKVRVLRSLNPAHADIVVSDEIDWLGWLDPKDQ